jgi:hypothetical protein
VPDATTRALELRKGSADISPSGSLSADMVGTLRRDPNLEVEQQPGTVLAYLAFNLRDPILKDVRVRQAMAYALDRRPMIEYLWRNQVQPALSILPRQSWAYNEDVPRYDYDPDKARQLLDALAAIAVATELKLPFGVIAPLLPAMRKQALIDIVGQKGGGGDATFEYEIKPPKGHLSVEDALRKSAYSGPAPVPFDDYVETIIAQTVRNFVCTRRTIHKAFKDLIITPEVLNEIGPAINSASSIFLFGYPGNGKTSIAERITRAFGQLIWIPRAIGIDGEIIRLFDPANHEPMPLEGSAGLLDQRKIDKRWVRIRRPTIVVGGELTMDNLEVTLNTSTGVRHCARRKGISA